LDFLTALVRKPIMVERQLLATVTGEHVQPVRLHYRVFDDQALLRTFKKLRCVDHDPARQRWVWLYDYEARKLHFQQSYPQIARHLHPIVIGSFFRRSGDKMHLDLRSCERATRAVVFFDRHISRKVAEVTEAEVVNRLFAAAENPTVERIFDEKTSIFCDPEAVERELIELTAGIPEPQERLRVTLEHMERRSKRPLPEMERFPIYFYEEGIQGFETALKMRQIIALQHWLGNSAYSMHDVLQMMRRSIEDGARKRE
jgi:hypothetical protein